MTVPMLYCRPRALDLRARGCRRHRSLQPERVTFAPRAIHLPALYLLLLLPIPAHQRQQHLRRNPSYASRYDSILSPQPPMMESEAADTTWTCSARREPVLAIRSPGTSSCTYLLTSPPPIPPAASSSGVSTSPSSNSSLKARRNTGTIKDDTKRSRSSMCARIYSSLLSALKSSPAARRMHSPLTLVSPDGCHRLASHKTSARRTVCSAVRDSRRWR